MHSTAAHCRATDGRAMDWKGSNAEQCRSEQSTGGQGRGLQWSGLERQQWNAEHGSGEEWKGFINKQKRRVLMERKNNWKVAKFKLVGITPLIMTYPNQGPRGRWKG